MQLAETATCVVAYLRRREASLRDAARSVPARRCRPLRDEALRRNAAAFHVTKRRGASLLELAAAAFPGSYLKQIAAEAN